MQNSSSPSSSGKVKFHGKAILLLFNYQPAPGRGAAQTGSPLYGCTKPGRPGCGGVVRGWERPENWQLGQRRLKLVLHGAEPWELAGWASQGGLAMGQLPSWLPDTQGCSSPSGLSQEVSGTLRNSRMGSDPRLSTFRQ